MIKHLDAYLDKNIYPFHMPGHKRNEAFFDFEKKLFDYDITEVDGMDNLHLPKGIIQELNLRLAETFTNGGESFLMVNGSSGGIIAAMMSVLSDSDKILVARNCHKSVFSGLVFSGAKPVYIYPSVTDMGFAGGIDPAAIEDAFLKDESIKAIILPSPTYEGLVSDIEKIAQITAKYKKILIVDEAHGAHFNFNDIFPKSAMALGADVVIHSLHKTLPTFTQTSVLHVQGTKVDRKRLAACISMVQTTSPSYIFMVAADKCLEFLKKKNSFDSYSKLLQKYRKSFANLNNIKLIGDELKGFYNIKDIDPSKLTFYMGDTKDIDYTKILREQFKLEIELKSDAHFVALSSVCDTAEGFMALEKGVLYLDGLVKPCPPIYTQENFMTYAKTVLSPREVFGKDTIEIDIDESAGQISADFVTPYPPGIPVVVPGEVITTQIVGIIKTVLYPSQKISILK